MNSDVYVAPAARSLRPDEFSRLEAAEVPPLRQRYVWLRHPDDSVLEAEPGEEIIVVHWIWDEEPNR